MRKYILGKEFTKTIVKFKISTHEHHFVLGLIEKKALRSFGNKFVPKKKHFRNRIYKSNYQIRN